jgi:hypothetical protein
MTTLPGKYQARLWPVLAILAAGAGLMWMGWSKRASWSGHSSAGAPPLGVCEQGNDRAKENGEEDPLHPSPPLSEEEKIERLLKTIEQSGVVFIRSGTEYDGAKAAAHLRDKLRASGLVRPTLDDFIEKIASRSSLTGQPYRVRLPDGRTVDAGPWLRMQCRSTSSESSRTSSKEGP